MIKNFFKKHSIHKKVVKQFDWLFAFNLPKFFILAAIFCGEWLQLISRSIHPIYHILTQILIIQILLFI